MKKALKIVWNVLQVFIIIYVILVTSLLFFENKYGFSQFGDYVIHNVDKVDAKNVSNLKEGDLLIVKKDDKLSVGDNVYYYETYNGNYVISRNKVTGVKKNDGDYLYTLNSGTSFFSSDRVIGDKTCIIPVMGKILSVVESKIGFVVYVLCPILIVFIYQVYQFLVVLRYEKIVELAKKNDSIADDEIL